MTLDGHRSNDDAPYVFASENYGRTWRSIRGNLPATAGSTRVIREDIRNENVLYLGCEFSAWVSIDRGLSWSKFAGGLPTVAVHELAIHPSAGEIVAGTHGRSLWILDATPLRQMSAKTLAADAHLYQPNSVVRWRRMPEPGSAGTRAFSGENPTSRAQIFYSLGKDAQSVKLQVLNLQGEVLFAPEAPAKKGLHKLEWDLAIPSPSGRGRRSARTGDYLVRLEVDGTRQQQTLSLLNDPDYNPPATSDEELRLMQALDGVTVEEEAADSSGRID
jgi:hypothetical protein